MKVLQLSFALLALLVAIAVAHDDTAPADDGDDEADDDSGKSDDVDEEDDEEDFDVNNPPKGVTCGNGVCTRKKIVTQIVMAGQPEAESKGWGRRRVRRWIRRAWRKIYYALKYKLINHVVRVYKVVTG